MEEEFIALVKSTKGNKPLEGAWQPIVLDIVRAAGFDARDAAIEPRKGRYYDQDGPTGDTYALNGSSGIAVLENDGATVWLNTVWCKVMYGDVPKLAQELKALIENARPLAPIVVSEYGEEIGEYPPSDVMGKHARDADAISTCIHRICRSWVDCKSISRTHSALVCRECKMRIVFPREIKTYGDLRAHFTHFQPT